MKCVADTVEFSIGNAGHSGKPHFPGRFFVERISTQSLRDTFFAAAEPVLPELNQIEALPDLTKCMHIAVTDPSPIDEFDTQFEAALGGLDKSVFVNADESVEQPDRRDGCFANPDRADLVALYETDA